MTDFAEGSETASELMPMTHAGDATPMYTGKTATELKASKRPTILAEAERVVFGARHTDYGHPLDDFTKTAARWQVLFADGIVTPEKVALAMIDVKISRLLNTPTHHDSQVDIAGYIQTYAMVVDERKRRADAA